MIRLIEQAMLFCFGRFITIIIVVVVVFTQASSSRVIYLKYNSD